MGHASHLIRHASTLKCDKQTDGQTDRQTDRRLGSGLRIEGTQKEINNLNLTVSTMLTGTNPYAGEKRP